MKRNKIQAYFVDYNGKIVGIFKTLRGALNMINRKELVNDADNVLRLVDNNGDEYRPTSGLRVRYGKY